MMRIYTVLSIVCCATLAGCGRGDCLPEPASDATPPRARLTVYFTDLATGRRDSLTVTDQDPAQTMEADEAGQVVVVYSGEDDEGMRSLYLGVTIHQTVGVGVQSKTPDVEPVTTSCPRRRLASRMPRVGGQGKRTLSLTMSAENWAGLRANTEYLVVRLRAPTSG